ncbi:hypothetical protein [Spirosoma panaciterrae]|uniref:hypothetical protein n=1 Tax=Spirosoma panaciterrae TaxID=496058 RepID=UPI000476BC7B|nr:hypothetical protein [Spirosoma panaciterrae]
MPTNCSPRQRLLEGRWPNRLIHHRFNGKTCSAHWAAADTFRQAFPRVKLQPDKLIPNEKGIYTNAGAYSFLNLLI